MPSFKTRTRQPRCNDTSRTLDEMHNSIMRTFNKQERDAEKIRQLIEDKTRKLEVIDIVKNAEAVAKIRKEIDDLSHKLQYLDSDFNMVSYYLQSEGILNDYYGHTLIKRNSNEKLTETEVSLLEDHKPDTNKVIPLDGSTKKEKRRRKPLPIKGIPILDMLHSIGKIKDNTDKNTKSKYKQKRKAVSNKGSLNIEYMSIINPGSTVVKKNRVTICDQCNIEMTLIRSEGIIVCRECGATENIVVESDIPSHSDSMNEKHKYPYKKINHFIEVLNRFQCKGGFDGKTLDMLIDKVDEEIRRLRISMRYVDVKKIRDILKKYKYGKYYDYTQYIYCKVTNTSYPHLERNDEEKAKDMFKKIIVPFDKYRPENRSNLLNYECILYKILQLLGYDEYALRCHLLKSREKLAEIDRIWEKICLDLEWKFIPFP